jgi:CO/xanthine dehydrogenase Mo-binding subunit
VGNRYFGAAVKRKEDFRFLTGRGDFVDGLNLPGTVQLAVLRSPCAHARILNVNAEKARNARGEIAVLFVRERFRLQRGSGQALEGRAVLATYDADSGTSTIWSNTQAPHLQRRILAELMDCDEEKIRIIVPDVGGGFGPKGIFYSENFLVPYLARLLVRPVKWGEDRREHFLSSVDGQIQGGVAHGISDCLYENLQYDQQEQLLTTSYLAYLLPTACDVPPVNVKHMEIPSTLNPIGVRGAGELGTIGAPAASRTQLKTLFRRSA